MTKWEITIPATDWSDVTISLGEAGCARGYHSFTPPAPDGREHGIVCACGETESVACYQPDGSWLVRFSDVH